MFQIGKKEGLIEWNCNIIEVLIVAWPRVMVFWDVLLD
jgi:hypothetical protein